jgi:hypothetical protein
VDLSDYRRQARCGKEVSSRRLWLRARKEREPMARRLRGL